MSFEAMNSTWEGSGIGVAGCGGGGGEGVLVLVKKIVFCVFNV